MMATVVHSARTPMYHGYGNGVDRSPPPPIPARLHHHRLPRPATALGQRDVETDSEYLAPVVARRGARVDGGPPLPPRQPLRRSVSLTHRAPPQQPGRDVTVAGLDERHGQAVVDTALHEPTLDEVLASLRRSRVDSLHPAPLSPALSAPLLGQVCDSLCRPCTSSILFIAVAPSLSTAARTRT